MRKIRNLIYRIPKPLRAFAGFLVICILVCLIYISVGFSSRSFEQEFRRVEQMNMVGPSTIVSQFDVNNSLDFQELIVGETDEGVVFFSRIKLDYSNTGSRYSYAYYYREKSEDITVLAAPPPLHFMMGDKLPVFVFDDYPEAVYAELTVTIDGVDSYTVDGVLQKKEYSKTFFAKNDRSADGHFMFTLEALVSDKYQIEQDALELFSEVCANSVFLKENVLAVTDITAKVKLYDKDRCVVVEKVLNITATSQSQQE